ncbi:MAG: DHH family phosphoesterase [Candidatus Komeilibacteria bacterium]
MANLDQQYHIQKRLRNARNVLIVAHKNPDGDTTGATTALLEILQNWGIAADAFCLTKVPDNFDYLPHSQRITQDKNIWKKNHDIVIVTDSGSLQYAGIDKLLMGKPKNFTLINIDHHVTNDAYGDLNYIDTKASSTCEVLYNLARHWHAPINSRLATCLLNGIVTDTGFLTNAATSADTLETVASLLKFGGHYSQVLKQNWRTKSEAALQLWGRALERIRFNPRFGAIYTFILHTDFIELGLDDNDTTGIINFLQSMEDVNLIMLLTETPDGYIKGSLRTIHDHINVAALAKALGGGGHQKASGFVISGKIQQNGDNINLI